MGPRPRPTMLTNLTPISVGTVIGIGVTAMPLAQVVSRPRLKAIDTAAIPHRVKATQLSQSIEHAQRSRQPRSGRVQMEWVTRLTV
jgi:hypothetical protein